ncbi:MAG: hypothetical protein EU531_02990 [Promethearchaeota archaeon]|nr:MAG: hypothetical protein EU531_02990 [Candidatus Lokiarchaeota archaeon]
MKKKNAFIIVLLLILLPIIGWGIFYLFSTEETAHNLELIDSHVLIECFTTEDCLKIENRLLEEMEKENIAKVILTGALITDSLIDSMIMNMSDRHPDKFLPFLSGFIPNASSTPLYIENQLKTGKWKGIGKIILSHISGSQPAYMPNDTVLLEIYGLADTYNVPVFFHIDIAAYSECKKPVEALKEIFTLFPNVTFIWHRGQITSEGFDPDMGCILPIVDYPNVVAEAEFHSPNMNLSSYEFYSELIQDNRYIIGSDFILSPAVVDNEVLYAAGGASYHETIQQTRTILSMYSDQTAKDIGYNNILKILGM